MNLLTRDASLERRKDDSDEKHEKSHDSRSGMHPAFMQPAYCCQGQGLQQSRIWQYKMDEDERGLSWHKNRLIDFCEA